MGRNIVLIKARKAFKQLSEEALKKVSQEMVDGENEAEVSNMSFAQPEFEEPEVSD